MIEKGQDIYEYKPVAIEKYIQQNYENNKTFQVVENSDKPKYYCLSMFPYPSGQLHMGHLRNYAIGDFLARYHRLCGKNVLHPMGWDAFGLPAENAARLHVQHPKQWTYQNISVMRGQLKRLGLSIDWSREFTTCDPQYYRWGQWLFIQMYKKGLIYRKEGEVNWDPVDQTVLANEQVVDGLGWRSGAPVEKKKINMYYARITQYAEPLLEDMELLQGWPKKVLSMQSHWIGRSEGANIKFYTPNNNDCIIVFTSRCETLWGVTFIAISVDHPWAVKAAEIDVSIADWIRTQKLGVVTEENHMKQVPEGICTPYYVKHPETAELIPVWITNYVLSSYGSGAVMGVPAHDDRDADFARRYSLVFRVTLDSETGALKDSGQWTGMSAQEAQKLILNDLVERGIASTQVNYRLRDWALSRQRYWGCPIPLVHCPSCGTVPVSDHDLPISLPDDIDLENVTTALESHPSWKHTLCPVCGGRAQRECDTLDTFVESSWYFMRFCSFNAETVVDQRQDYWMGDTGVDCYIGGIEHAVMHLLYARFWTKVMKDLGLVKTEEPFKCLLTQGMVLAPTFYSIDNRGRKTWFSVNDVILNGKDYVTKEGRHSVVYDGWQKMSKSKNNGVNPDHMIDKYGVDAVRLFMIFSVPPCSHLEWSESGVDGATRFLKRVWNYLCQYQLGQLPEQKNSENESQSKNLRHLLHKTIQKVRDDIEKRQQLNTVVSALMALFNELNGSACSQSVRGEVVKAFLLMLHPVCPHLTEYAWSYILKYPHPLLEMHFPSVDKTALLNAVIRFAIQVNGKTRGFLELPSELTQEEIHSQVCQSDIVLKHIQNGLIKKVIIVPNRLVNVVVS